ncbi:hypothetical protein HBI81_084460 [Parastagonospora nodorum]|nr:hypothetical protein HBI32_107510 [Parastagonospora nodorum]KAH5761225.1 hypothetical protein HBI97_193640 [Parastagonospora nodorum]KAH5819343.1 hypothetical protein HBI96_051700 [Parastagonospora nodorum]KAH5820634.1 hypothetical protein HBI93_178830 [Parastagonospora nodorum]KAH5836394.1 hypothetical protein HBI94_008910 [Parastagonospora nodorum]
MENSSATHSSRVPNSSLLKAPDNFPQKRASSYRRPVDAQPTFVPVEPPATATAMPSNTARPVATAPNANGVSRGSSHRRRQSQHIPPPTTGAMNESVPAAPDVPRAPPMSYKDPYGSKASARGPPRQQSARAGDPAIQLNPSRQQPIIQSAADRLISLRSPPYAPVEPLSGAVERRGSQRKPSVPDRSPLQKLEGKLDDISKEERRARILEAELIAQEKAEAERRERRAREAAEKQQRVVEFHGPSEPEAPSNAAPPVRKASTRRNVSMPVQNRTMSPAISDMESEIGYDVSEPWDPSAGQTATASARQQLPSQKQRASSGSYTSPHTNTTIARNHSVKGKEPIGVARGSGSFRDRSAGSAQNISRKPIANAAGLGLEGVGDTSGGAEVSRANSKRVSSAPVPAGRPVSNDRRRDSRGIMAAQMEMQQQQIDHKNTERGLNQHPVHPVQPLQPVQPYKSPVVPTVPITRKSVSFSGPESDLQQQPSHESHHHHHHFRHDTSDDGSERRYVAPPMLEEWRKAPIGALVAEDLDLDAPARANNTNKAWWEESQAARRRRSSSGYAEPTYDGYADQSAAQTSFSPALYLKCGPLLRYTGLRRDKSRPGKEKEIWRGSVMIVTVDAESSYTKPPTLRLFKQPMDILPPPPREVDDHDLDPAYVDPIEGQYKVSRTGKTLYVKPVDEIAEDEDLSRIEDDTGIFCQTRSAYGPNGSGARSSRIHKKDGEKLGKFREVPGVRLHAERGVTFWRFNLEIELGTSQARVAYRINHGPAVGFWVPAKGESMNIMFHSCNGFSFSVDSNQFCGPDPLWRDVLNTHQNTPFHVMIGGGDQIYNDAAMRQTTLFKQWTENKNPLQKHNAPFTEEMQNELEQFYLDRYSMWFSQGLFGMANSQIPMVNIWDDHDIIDGFGSYPHHFMQTPVFTGIGAVAFKYYMLFQHQSVSAETEATEPSWVLGKSPGPYIKERSRSVFMQLGREVAFLGLDCRTERQRDEILTEDSYDVIFDRVEAEVIKGETKHLIVLLGVPIAYPRLNFLENILTSRLMDPIKAMGRAGMLGNFVNKFDGGVEILDDLDDHWTAKHHKEERNWLIRELQHIASTKSVRVTILGGDVHLAAVGQFFTNKKLNVPKDKDHRYMMNVISSAIVNTPPPDMMADIINKRNKIHHMDHETDENMIPIFTHGVDGKKRNNNHLLPHRNWCSIREFKPGSTPPGTPSPPPTPQDARRPSLGQMVRRFSSDQGGRPGRSRGPPVSYYNNPSNAAADELQTGAHHQPQSSFSPDRSESERPRSRRNSLTSLFKRRASVDNVPRPTSAKSVPGVGNRGSADYGPSTFHRRPSVLGKSGLKQQGEGDFVNLQGGLEICLNMEVSQHDPAGITAPYRLIVPALNYTAPVDGVVEKQPRKSGMFGGMFGGAKQRKRAKIGDDGYSMSGSESGSELGEVSSEDEEERAREKHKVGPRIVIPGFGSKNKRNSLTSAKAAPAENRLSSGYYTNSTQDVVPQNVDMSRNLAPPPPQDRRQSMDVAGAAARSPVWNSVAAKRHVSAPHPSQTSTHTTADTSGLPFRSNTVSRKQPTHNSSHKSQLPALVPDPDPKVHRKSMGGILNQHGGEQFEQEAHVLSHTPSRNKRDSYPPHPAIVGGGPGSPYSRNGMGMQARQDTGPGDYFSSGGREGQPAYPVHPVHPAHGSRGGHATPGAEQRKPRPITAEYAQMPRAGYDRTAAYPSYPSSRNGSAGVGARYLGGGRYEDDDYDSLDDDEDDGSHSGRGEEMSQESFVPPKKKKWQIWK